MVTSPSAPADLETREADAPAPADTRVDSRAVSASLAAADADAIHPGARIGRYLVVEVVGSGGIGIVYAAYDPDLDRKVALKLLRRSKLTGGSNAISQRRGRLRREALALARLSHPNVVPVYEVGTFEDQIYVVMEFVEGSTLGEWLAHDRRSWAEIVAMFVQAGRGLAAAHAADIVHRDFKPENVRVGTDGRVRVLDFGLAGPLREGDGETSQPGFGEGFGSASSSAATSQRRVVPELDSAELAAEIAVTREGQVMGTPAYMAPEQAAAGLVDARSDQFSFCVALYEAVYGERPFRGRHDDPRRYRELARARSLPGRRPADLPGELERVILKGLSLDPQRRYPDMDTLVAELTAIAEGPRRLWWVPVAIVALAMTAVIGFYERDDAKPVACDDGQGMLEGVWDPAVAGRLRAAVLRSSKPYAGETWATVERSLSTWTERWRRARVRACEATHVYADQSPELLERRIACLDRQLVRVESMLSALRELEPRPDDLLERLTPLLARVPSPETCAAANLFDGAQLEPSNETDAHEAEAIREQLAVVEGLTDVGEYAQAIARGEQALVRAKALGFEPVTAEASLILGLARERHGVELSKAAELLEGAAWAAERSGHERALIRAAAAMSGNLGRQAKLETAELWAKLARAAFVRRGDDPELEIELRTNLGDLAMARGDFQAALAEYGRARDLARERGEGHPEHLVALRAIGDSLRELGRYDEAAEVLAHAREIASAQLGAKHPMIPNLLDALGNVEASRGRYSEALELHRASLAILVELHGELHRDIAKTLNNMAIIFDETGRYAESVETLERARVILVEFVGTEHPDVAFVDVNIGSALQNLERDGEAVVRYEAALTSLERSFGAEHMAVGVTLQNLGSARTALGDHDAALADYERAEQILVAVFGREHPSVAELELNRARSLARLDRHEDALAAFERARVTRTAIYGPTHAELVEVLSGQSEIELALGHRERARELAEQAVDIVAESTPPAVRAAAMLALADALIDGPRASSADRARARELGRAALRLLDASEAGDKLRQRTLAWLRAHAELDDAPG